MITRMDRDIGRLFQKLRDLGLDEKTIVFFSSDNGPHKEGGADPKFFHSSGPLKGYKRAVYEGGIRVPGIVRWPGRVKAGATSDLPWAFWDFLPTAVELAGSTPPDGLDGISIVPTLLGQGKQPRHEFMYWEFHEGPSSTQAVRMDRGKPCATASPARSNCTTCERTSARRTIFPRNIPKSWPRSRRISRPPGRRQNIGRCARLRPKSRNSTRPH